MPPELTVAALGAVVTAAGWLTTHALREAADRRRARQQAELAHVERQLAELYGPLAFLLTEGRQTFADLLALLGRSHVFAAGRPLPPDELATWLFWVEHDFLPRNARIRDLLAERTHLIEGDRMPPSFVAFLQHHSSWQVQHARWRADGQPYAWHSSINWPTAFATDVLASFERLKRRHAALVAQLQPDGPPAPR